MAQPSVLGIHPTEVETMISLAEKTIDEINDIVHRGTVLIFTSSFDGVINENSRRYLVTEKILSPRNKRICRLMLYEVGASPANTPDYDTSSLFQHRMHYHIIP